MTHTHSRRLFTTAALLLCLLAATEPATAGETYHSSASGFSVTVPDGWVKMPASQLAQFSGAISAQPDAPQVEAGYLPPGVKQAAGTFLFVAARPYPGDRQPSEREMNEIVQAMSPANMPSSIRQSNPSALASQALKSVTFDGSSYDPKARAFDVKATFRNGPRPLHMHIYGIFGHEKMAVLYTYALDPGAARMESEYAKAAQTFHFDPEYAFVDTSATVRKVVLVVGGVIALGAVLAVVAVVITVARRGKAKPAPYGAPGYGGQPYAYGAPQYPPQPQYPPSIRPNTRLVGSGKALRPRPPTLRTRNNLEPTMESGGPCPPYGRRERI